MFISLMCVCVKVSLTIMEVMPHSGFIEASIHICFNASVYAENLLGRNNNFNINTHGGRFYGLLITPSAFTKTCLDFRNCSVLADSVIIHVRKNL